VYLKLEHLFMYLSRAACGGAEIRNNDARTRPVLKRTCYVNRIRLSTLEVSRPSFVALCDLLVIFISSL